MGYQWNDLELKKKSSKYNWVGLIVMIVALGVFVILPNYWSASSTETLNYIVLVIVALAFILFVLSWRLQNQDRKLKKKE